MRGAVLVAALAAALAAAALLPGCVVVGGNAYGVAGWTSSTNGEVMARWVFPVWQWQRSARSSASSKTYVLGGLAGWRRNRFGELAETWMHPLWYRDRITVENHSSNIVTRTTQVAAGLLVSSRNVHTLPLEAAKGGAHWGPEVVLDDIVEVTVMPGFRYSRRNGRPPRVSALWGLWRNAAERDDRALAAAARRAAEAESRRRSEALRKAAEAAKESGEVEFEPMVEDPHADGGGGEGRGLVL